jgi:4-amino-4-deoxy-L-arabinose transferase-like glycosyltransferase
VRRIPPRLAGLACVLAGWLALYAMRVRDGFSNVDDYLYAGQADAFRRGAAHGPRALAHAWSAYAQNSPLVPALGAPLTAVTKDPTVLVLVELPLLLALWLGLHRLGRLLGLADRAAWVTATVVAVSPAVLGYAVMWHFAVAATATLVWALVAYLRSDRLRERRWAVAFGILVGLLTLTRSVAVVYLAALALACAVDLLLDRTDARRRAAHLGLAVAAGAVVAGPWWAVAGRTAYRYLRNAGYDAGSGFTAGRGSALGTAGLRLRHTAAETGLVVTVLLVALLAAALARALRDRDRAVLLTVAVALAGLGGLATSSNLGTAFALPLVAVAAVAAATAVRRIEVAAAALAVALAALLGQLGALPNATVADLPLWVAAYPGRGQAFGALGGAHDLSVARRANAQVVANIRGSRTLLVRDDALVNAQSLTARLRPADGVLLGVAPFGAMALTDADLGGADVVVAGTTEGPYHPGLVPAAVEARLRDAGFAVYLRIVLSDRNEVVLWRR